MKNYQNIEDLFKDKFDGLRSSPNSDLWGKIENQLDEASFFQKKFEGYRVNPGNKIWFQIRNKLLWYDFLKFSYSSFNLYYLLTVLSLITASLIYFNNTQKSIPVAMNCESVSGHILNMRGLSLEKNMYSETKTMQPGILVENRKKDLDIQLAQIIDNLNKSENIPSGQVSSEKVIEQTKDEENILISEEVTITVDYDIFNENIPEAMYFETTDIDDSGTPDAEIVNIEPTDIYSPDILDEEVLIINPDISVPIVPSTESDINSKTDISEILKPEYIVSKKSIPIVLFDIDLREEYIYREDTFGVDANDNPIVIETSNWSVEGFYSYMNNQSTFCSKDADEPFFLQDYQSSYSPSNSNNYGMHLNYLYRKIFLQTGFMLTEFTQNFSFDDQIISVDTSFNEQTIVYSYSVPDTISFIDMDYFIATGDTQYVYLIQYHKEDSSTTTLIPQYDSLSHVNTYKSVNSYRYFEIPLMLGYQFKINKFAFTPKVGIISGFLIKTSGLTFASNQTDKIAEISKDCQPYLKTILSYSINFEVDYQISKSICMTIDPFIRKNLSS
ncbi:MAG: hypothetical protein ABIJ97_12100, partial [Bacteroidota bacterium]